MTGPLISAAELADRLDDVTVLDVRWQLGGPPGEPLHREGHVPGAAYVDLEADLSDAPGAGGRHPLPSVERFQQAMRLAGVSAQRPVVVYDGAQGFGAGRAWWLLRHHGHADVRVLDGGWAAWQAHGGEMERGGVSAVPGDFTARPGQMPVATPEELGEVEVLIDARAPERYRGETEPIDPVAGHIPGAVNLPTSRHLDETGHFRSAEELRALYAEVGVEPGSSVAAYCGSGVSATQSLIAMEIAGIRAALYPGSWSGWITDPTRPVARG